MRKWKQTFIDLAIGEFPELMNLPEDERIELLNEGIRQTYPSWRSGRFWLWIPELVVFMAAAYGYIYVYAPNITAANSVYHGLVFIVPVAVYMYLKHKIVARIDARVRRSWLHDVLLKRAHRPLACLFCGYDLRGTPDASDACPECGGRIATLSDSTAQTAQT